MWRLGRGAGGDVGSGLAALYFTRQSFAFSRNWLASGHSLFRIRPQMSEYQKCRKRENMVTTYEQCSPSLGGEDISFDLAGPSP